MLTFSLWYDIINLENKSERVIAVFDKYEVKEQMSLEEVELILENLGAHFYRESDEKLIIETICHNELGEGSHKLYYYTNTKLFNCYTSCGSFDIFELIQKSLMINENEDISLDEAVRHVVDKRGFTFFGGSATESVTEEVQREYVKPELKTYDRKNFDRLQPAIVKDWFEEGITPELQKEYEVKYNPVDGAVVFPHYSSSGELVGVRQRNLAHDMIERFGKYRPAIIRGTMYTSPLSFYLFGVFRNKWPITKKRQAIVFEGKDFALVYLSSNHWGLSAREANGETLPSKVGGNPVGKSL